jgi:transcriptional regulator with XRE-family HTH domain
MRQQMPAATRGMVPASLLESDIVKHPLRARHCLAKVLRSLRELAQLKQRVIAERAQWSESKVIRIEAATVHISITDVRAWLAVCGHNKSEDVEAINALAHASRGRGWWGSYRTAVGAVLTDYYALESAAVALDEASSIIPDLLQTEPYAAYVSADFWADAERIALDWRILRRRQALLQTGVPMTFYLDAHAVSHVGGFEPAVHIVQCRHLLRVLAEYPHVTVRIVPGGADRFALAYGPFRRVTIIDEPYDAVVYHGDPTGRVRPERTDTGLAAVSARLGRLDRVSLSRDDSIDVIAKSVASTHI